MVSAAYSSDLITEIKVKADQGDAKARYQLGNMYSAGSGVVVDKASGN